MMSECLVMVVGGGDIHNLWALHISPVIFASDSDLPSIKKK